MHDSRYLIYRLLLLKVLQFIETMTTLGITNNERLVLAVSVESIGIKAEDLPRLFTHYWAKFFIEIPA